MLNEKSNIVYTGTDPIEVSGYTINHKTSGVTAGSKGDTSAKTPGFGGTFKALSATVNAKGHVTALGEHNVTIPNATATTSTAGLMSSTDKTKLNGIESGAEVNVNADWNASSGDAKILNKPTTISGYGITDAYTKTEIDNAKQDKLTFDDAPTTGSNNPVKSGGIKSALDGKQNSLTFDSAPTNNSANPVTSGGVYTAIDALEKQIEELQKKVEQPNIYGVKWDGTTHQMTRILDAKNITTDTTNFVYSGTVNANYSNPFDSIYPWSDCRQCNVDMTLYAALDPGDDIRDAVVAWYGDPDFETDGTNGFVGRYTPEFWYSAFDADDGRLFAISDKKIAGWNHHKPSIRSIGFAVDDGNDGVTSNDGQPLTNIQVSAIHTRATTAGMTLQNIYELDAQDMLAVVEFASYDAQRVMGDGCSSCSYEPEFTLTAAATGATTVLLPVAAKQYCIPGATLDFGASKGAVVISNRREIVSVADYDATYCQATFTPALDLTTSMYPSIHGKNNADSFGNKSGYLGTAGKNNAWYRGAIMWGNRNQYTLGIARKTGTSHVWLCPEEDCDDYDGLNETAFYDTGIVVPIVESNAWKSIGNMKYPNGIMAVGVIDEFASIVGDSQYCVTAATGNTTPFFGGYASLGAHCGFCCAGWTAGPGSSYWGHAGVLLLKTP